MSVFLVFWGIAFLGVHTNKKRVFMHTKKIWKILENRHTYDKIKVLNYMQTRTNVRILFKKLAERGCNFGDVWHNAVVLRGEGRCGAKIKNTKEE